MESARQQVLRLLGETSSLKNQLAQMDEYLAAIQRDRTRSEKEAEVAESERVRLDGVKADLSAAHGCPANGTRVHPGPSPRR